MPIYEYRCANGHDFEVVQKMTDDPVEVCEVCGEPVARVFSPVAVHYRGSGFYTTDYARKGEQESTSKAGDGGEGKSDSGKSAKPEGSEKKKSAAKD